MVNYLPILLLSNSQHRDKYTYYSQFLTDHPQIWARLLVWLVFSQVACKLQNTVVRKTIIINVARSTIQITFCCRVKHGGCLYIVPLLKSVLYVPINAIRPKCTTTLTLIMDWIKLPKILKCSSIILKCYART